MLGAAAGAQSQQLTTLPWWMGVAIVAFWLAIVFGAARILLNRRRRRRGGYRHAHAGGPIDDERSLPAAATIELPPPERR
jgi:hypothetical protein